MLVLIMGLFACDFEQGGLGPILLLISSLMLLKELHISNYVPRPIRITFWVITVTVGAYNFQHNNIGIIPLVITSLMLLQELFINELRKFQQRRHRIF